MHFNPTYLSLACYSNLTRHFDYILSMKTSRRHYFRIDCPWIDDQLYNPSRSRKSIEDQLPKSRRRLTNPLRLVLVQCVPLEHVQHMERFHCILPSKLIFFLFYHKACQISAFQRFSRKTVLLFSFLPIEFSLFGLFIV